MVTASRVQITVLRGRDDECRAVRSLLDGVTDGGGALLLHGEPGSGRTALLTYAHRYAENCVVLAGAGLPAEATLPYAGLQRLLDPVRDRTADLPEPQRHLLRRALDGEGCPPDRRLALSVAVLGLLGAAARERPLLVTMDDLDRGDGQTAQVLAFVARRLRHLPMAVLLTADVTATVDGVATCRLGPLSRAGQRCGPGRPAARTTRRAGGGHPRRDRRRQPAGARGPRRRAEPGAMAGGGTATRHATGRRRAGPRLPGPPRPPAAGHPPDAAARRARRVERARDTGPRGRRRRCGRRGARPGGGRRPGPGRARGRHVPAAADPGDGRGQRTARAATAGAPAARRGARRGRAAAAPGHAPRRRDGGHRRCPRRRVGARGGRRTDRLGDGLDRAVSGSRTQRPPARRRRPAADRRPVRVDRRPAHRGTSAARPAPRHLRRPGRRRARGPAARRAGVALRRRLGRGVHAAGRRRDCRDHRPRACRAGVGAGRRGSVLRR